MDAFLSWGTVDPVDGEDSRAFGVEPQSYSVDRTPEIGSRAESNDPRSDDSAWPGIRPQVWAERRKMTAVRDGTGEGRRAPPFSVATSVAIASAAASAAAPEDASERRPAL
jgi:hypothetical protein